MIVFINDKAHYIVSQKEFADLSFPDMICLNATKNNFDTKEIGLNTAFLNPSEKAMERVIEGIFDKRIKHYKRLFFVGEDKELLEEQFKDPFKIIKAAGGVVEKEGKILLIHRLGKWDLPKGKLDENEKSKQAAVREIEEECNVKSELKDKICTTWHTYTMGGRKVLKRTKWYRLQCLDDSKMKPQKEENIDAIEWKTPEEAHVYMQNSYASIAHVLKEYIGTFAPIAQ